MAIPLAILPALRRKTSDRLIKRHRLSRMVLPVENRARQSETPINRE